MLHASMSTPSPRPVSEAPEVAALERELAVLVRHLDGFGRRSDVYAGVAAGRSGYLLLMTLALACIASFQKRLIFRL